MQPRSTPITIIFKAAALSCSTLFPPASLFPSFSVFFLFSFFSVLFLLHFEEKKAKSESVYRVSLDPVQNLCLLDENPAVSQKERGIRNWTIFPERNGTRIDLTKEYVTILYIVIVNSCYVNH